MKQKPPREYLEKVLKDWTEFCKGHRRFKTAIEEILKENEQLKSELEKLKGQ